MKRELVTAVVCKDLPMVAFRRGSNISDVLVGAPSELILPPVLHVLILKAAVISTLFMPLVKPTPSNLIFLDLHL